MTLDLSYINEQPSEAQEEAVKRAVEQECIRAIATYLVEVANAMDANEIETLNSASLRAMADQFTQRLKFKNLTWTTLTSSTVASPWTKHGGALGGLLTKTERRSSRPSLRNSASQQLAGF